MRDTFLLNISTLYQNTRFLQISNIYRDTILLEISSVHTDILLLQTVTAHNICFSLYTEKIISFQWLTVSLLAEKLCSLHYILCFKVRYLNARGWPVWPKHVAYIDETNKTFCG
jgi:hypothetical protein